MRKLGVAGALALVSVCSLWWADSVRADEPPDFSSWRQPRATAAVLTSRGGRNADFPVAPARATRASDPREAEPAAESPWIIRGTLGMSDSRH